MTSINVYLCLSNYLESTRLLAKLYHMRSVFHFALQVLLQNIVCSPRNSLWDASTKPCWCSKCQSLFSIKYKILKVAMYITNIQEVPSSHFRIFTSRGTKKKRRKYAKLIHDFFLFFVAIYRTMMHKIRKMHRCNLNSWSLLQNIRRVYQNENELARYLSLFDDKDKCYLLTSRAVFR